MRRTPTTTPPPPQESFTLRLKDLLWRFEEANSLTRLLILTQLRQYVKTTDLQTVLDEIKTIDDHDQLNVLIGAGMPGVLYYAVLARKAFLLGLT